MIGNLSLCGVVATVAVGLSIGSAQASDLCATVTQLVSDARGNFPDRSSTGTFSTALPDRHECALALQLGGLRTMTCQWPFELRDAQARETFEQLAQGIETCTGTIVLLDQDQQVNHPDTYDLRKFEKESIAIDVSLKDKGALQQTFVFLRIDGAATK